MGGWDGVDFVVDLLVVVIFFPLLWCGPVFGIVVLIKDSICSLSKLLVEFLVESLFGEFSYSPLLVLSFLTVLCMYCFEFLLWSYSRGFFLVVVSLGGV